MVKGLVTGFVCVLLAACGTSHKNASPPPPPSTTTTASTIPASTTTAATTTTTIPSSYVVQQGDTLTSIAQRFHITVTALTKANNITNADKVEAGQTLTIPAAANAASASIAVTPTTGPQGQLFHLTLTGAQPGEKVTFTVKSPKGSYTGPTHTAPSSGTVTTTYKTALSDPTGTYSVVISGNQGTAAHATFVVTTSTTTST